MRSIFKMILKFIQFVYCFCFVFFAVCVLFAEKLLIEMAVCEWDEFGYPMW